MLYRRLNRGDASHGLGRLVLRYRETRCHLVVLRADMSLSLKHLCVALLLHSISYYSEVLVVVFFEGVYPFLVDPLELLLQLNGRGP